MPSKDEVRDAFRAMARERPIKRRVSWLGCQPDALKRCPRCGAHKPRRAFGQMRRGNGTVITRGYCRPCDAARQREYQQRVHRHA